MTLRLSTAEPGVCSWALAERGGTRGVHGQQGVQTHRHRITNPPHGHLLRTSRLPGAYRLPDSSEVLAGAADLRVDPEQIRAVEVEDSELGHFQGGRVGLDLPDHHREFVAPEYLVAARPGHAVQFGRVRRGCVGDPQL